MTVTWPEGAVMGLPRDRGVPAEADDAFSGAGTLLALALAYQAAQFQLSRRTEIAARMLWAQLGPVSDRDMRDWVERWDALLAAQAAQQRTLTAAYIGQAMSRFGVEPAGVSLTVSGVPSSAREWLGSRYAAASTSALRSAVEDAVQALEAGSASVAQAALADRVGWLHSPVVKVRWGLSTGLPAADALARAGDFVEEATYNAGRAVERIVMGASGWPAFKNGVAMMYRRVTHPGACGWCRLVATRLYSLASFKATGGGTSAQWHAWCRCTWAPVTFDEARTYAGRLKDSDGDYYAAARAIGLWDGDAPENWRDIERQRATSGAGAAPSVAPLRPDPRAQERAARLAQREAEAVALVSRANELNGRARALFAAGDPEGARRLYAQAYQLTSQALGLRTGT